MSDFKKWHPLTEFGQDNVKNKNPEPANNDKKGCPQFPTISMPKISETLAKLLWDILVYPFCTVTVRIRRLSISARAYELAKTEGQEHKLLVESSAGSSKYLFGTAPAYPIYKMEDPFDQGPLREHSFYNHFCAHVNKYDPRVKSVYTEFKLGTSGSCSDTVTVGHDGSRTAWEVTLNSSNILSNAEKYAGSDFIRIIFLCRDYRLREAVRACIRESQLSTQLLERIEYQHFSEFLNRQRKFAGNWR